MLLNYCLRRGSSKCSILSIFCRLGLFLQFFGHVKEIYFRFALLTLDLHEMVRVSYGVACTIGFILFRDLVRHETVLNLMKNDSFQISYQFGLFSSSFKIGQDVTDIGIAWNGNSVKFSCLSNRFFLFFCFEILVDMGGVLEYMRNGKS